MQRSEDADLSNIPRQESVEQLQDTQRETGISTSAANGFSLPSIFAALSERLKSSTEPEEPDLTSSLLSTDSSGSSEQPKLGSSTSEKSTGDVLSASAVLTVLSQLISQNSGERPGEEVLKEIVDNLEARPHEIDPEPRESRSEEVSSLSLLSLLSVLSEKVGAASSIAKGGDSTNKEKGCEIEIPSDSAPNVTSLASNMVPSLSSVLAALSAGVESSDLGQKMLSIASQGAGNGSVETGSGSEHPTEKQKGDLVKTDSSSPILLSLLSTLGARIEELTTVNVQGVLQRLEGAKADLSEQAMLGTMRALGVEPFDSENGLELPQLPQRPFDPVLALVLAGYSFRAYQSPPRNSYRETFLSTVLGSELSGLPDQIVQAEFVYLDNSIISRRANGLFMFRVHSTDEKDKRFITAEVNGAVVLDIVTKGNCSLLRQTDPQGTTLNHNLHREQDYLTLSLYENAAEYDAGSSPTHVVSAPLADIVAKGLEVGTIVDGEIMHLGLKKVSEEQKNMNFFQFSLLPREMRLPFQRRQENEVSSGQTSGSSASLLISVQATFVPFPKKHDVKSIRRADNAVLNQRTPEQEPEHLADEELQLVLDRELAPGSMPDPEDWTKFAGAVRSLVHRVGPKLNIERTSTVTENVPGSLFIESLATDTEVYFFHDERNKDIIISFRGTEQVSWKDFFTDAQIFLQQWAPGDEINLNVDLSTTVGLADMVPSIFPNTESAVPEESSAVHYGFLRAYMSVRDALFRGLDMLSSNLSEGYSYHFTGHSLGGALAIMAASDFQARHMFDTHDVSCISYGAPKVGNLYFAKLYNELVPNSFRVVNDTDLVSRMPRSLAGSSPLGRYKHAGRTVLVNDDGEFWMEGQTAATANGMVLSALADPFREKYQNLQDLVEFEQKLWTQLLSGRSVQHHMVRCRFLCCLSL